MKNKSNKTVLASLFAAGALALSMSAMANNPPTEPEVPNTGYQRGPDPSVSFLEADRGPYSVDTERVSGLVSGFGGGTIHYPTDTTGTMAAIVVIPGYVSAESSIEWWGPKLASYGFVVMTIDTNSGFDLPPSRARQINTALDYLIDENSDSRSPVEGMIDTERLGVVGWSMGGGGTLRVAEEGRLKASAFYNDIPSSTDKAFIEINNGSHYCGNGGGIYNDVLARLGVSWMKRYLDEDQRYDQFICGPNHESDFQISDYRGNCQ